MGAVRLFCRQYLYSSGREVLFYVCMYRFRFHREGAGSLIFGWPGLFFLGDSMIDMRVSLIPPHVAVAAAFCLWNMANTKQRSRV
jgi:hypothetical protein